MVGGASLTIFAVQAGESIGGPFRQSGVARAARPRVRNRAQRLSGKPHGRHGPDHVGDDRPGLALDGRRRTNRCRSRGSSSWRWIKRPTRSRSRARRDGRQPSAGPACASPIWPGWLTRRRVPSCGSLSIESDYETSFSRVPVHGRPRSARAARQRCRPLARPWLPRPGRSSRTCQEPTTSNGWANSDSRQREARSDCRFSPALRSESAAPRRPSRGACGRRIRVLPYFQRRGRPHSCSCCTSGS